ncbi:1025_t:CDS:2, partial [Dentiscutata erythropus]
GTSNLETRYGHSAALTSDGRIIVYGGQNFNGFTPSPVLIVLDTNTYKWTSPTTSGSPEPEPVTYHSADIYDKYMIIAFGNLTSTVFDPTGPTSQIYILDVDNYEWISSYTYKSPTTTTPDKPNSTSGSINSTTNTGGGDGFGSKTIGIIVAICVGSIGVCILIIAALCIGFKKFAKKKDKNLTPPQPYQPPQPPQHQYQ